MDTCIFCGAEIARSTAPHPTCQLCHDFIYADAVGEAAAFLTAFRLGALMAARVNATGDQVRAIACQAEQRRRTLGILE